MITDTSNTTPAFGKARRSAMRQRAIEFRDSELSVPARIRPENVANLLGIHTLVLSSMTAGGLISCLGNPQHNGTRRYYGPYILGLRQNADFLDEVERYARCFWKDRSVRSNGGKAPVVATVKDWKAFPIAASDFRHLLEVVPPLSIDPIVGIGVAAALLGFADHEIRLLVRKGHLPAAGDTNERFCQKRFHFGKLLNFYRDCAWVDRAERSLAGYWQAKNHTVREPVAGAA